MHLIVDVASQFAADEALTHLSIVTQIASSLNTPHLPTRKSLIDLLSFLTYWNEGQAHPLVINALETLSLSNNEAGGCYEYWFKSMEQSLSGRGKMGSLVGASEEVRRTGGVDSSLNEYAVCSLMILRTLVVSLTFFAISLAFEPRSYQWHSCLRG